MEETCPDTISITASEAFWSTIRSEAITDDESAVEEAKSAARELLASKVLKGEIVDGDVFEITTSNGKVVEILPLRSVLRLTWNASALSRVFAITVALLSTPAPGFSRSSE
jgi:hypothetical protein